MDTTAKYIEMCKKAVEIQKVWKRRIGDYMYDGVNIQISTGASWEDVDLGILSYSSVIIETIKGAVGMGYFRWLPRQDQLQEMAFPDKSTSSRQMIEELHLFVKSSRLFCPSMEQLWLAFVMKEKYHKVWSTTKKDWVGQQEE